MSAASGPLLTRATPAGSPLVVGDVPPPPRLPIVIGVLLFRGVTLLDFAGPLQIFTFAPGLNVVLVSETGAPVKCFEKVSVCPHHSFEDCPGLDVQLAPGGGGIPAALGDLAYRRFLQEKGREVRWATSVCHGSLLLAAAGILDGYEAITRWGWLDCLLLFGPRVRVPTDYYARYHIDRNRITGGGISSGIDAVLAMVAAFVGGSAGDRFARQSQLGNQYAPAPPFNDGLPHSADPRVLAAVSTGMESLVKQTEDAIRAILGG